MREHVVMWSWDGFRRGGGAVQCDATRCAIATGGRVRVSGAQEARRARLLDVPGAQTRVQCSRVNRRRTSPDACAHTQPPAASADAIS